MQIKRFLGNFAKTYLALGALSVSAYAGADDFSGHPANGGWNNGCAPVCAPMAMSYAPDCEPCTPPCPQPQAPHCAWGYNPPGYFLCEKPCNPCGGNFLNSLSVEADFLYWRATSEGTTLGYLETNAALATGAPTTDHISYVETHANFEPAFRIGLNYYNECCNWDGGIVWTHFHTKQTASSASSFATGTSYAAFHPAWESVAGSIPDAATGKWTLDLDYIDLEVGHKYYVASCFKLRPFLGIRVARLDQNYSYAATAGRTGAAAAAATAVGASSNAFTSAVVAKNQFVGAGPRAGLDLEFDFGYGVSLFGQAAGSFVYGRYHRHSTEAYQAFDVAAGPVLGFTQSIPSRSDSGTISDLAIGLKWERCVNWCSGCHPIGVAISWEHHGFYDFADFGFSKNAVDYDTTVTTAGVLAAGNGTAHARSRGTIYTQGLTVAFNVGF